MKIEVNMHPTGVSLAYGEEHADENLPFQLNLDYKEAEELFVQLRDVMAAQRGYERLSVPVVSLHAGDLLFERRDLKVRNIALGTHDRVFVECDGPIHKTDIDFDDTDILVPILRDIE